MSKVSIGSILSGFRLTEINEAFQKLEDELNDKVLYRDPPTGEPNAMESSLDMNGFTIYNASSVSTNSLSINGEIVVPSDLAVTTLPLQATHSGKYLQTDGSGASWQTINADLVDFVQADSGAVNRTVQDKLREVVSAADYYTNDYAAAIQAAFNTANGTGRTVIVPWDEVTISSGLSQVNHSHYVVDWGRCRVTFTGGAGTYLLDMQQAGRINHRGGVFVGTGENHFVRTRGSAAAQATVFPTIPDEEQWSRQLEIEPAGVLNFDTAFDLQNFSREVWIGGYIIQNLTAVKITGKVVNLYARKGAVFYSSLASSRALLCRGDAGDAAFRFAEGLFFAGVIMDTIDTPVDARDFYLLDLSGAQIKSAAGGIAVDITKGICPLTREVFLSRALMQGRLRIGTGLAVQHLFALFGTDLSFSDTDGTAIIIEANCKGVLVNGCMFNNPTGTPRMFSVGANCASIRLQGLEPDAGTYTNSPTIDPTSYAGVKAEYITAWTPGIAFGGAAVGVTYATQVGYAYIQNGMVTGYFTLHLSNKGSSVGAATITGLPLQCLGMSGSATVSKFSSMNTSWTPILEIAQNSSVISVRNGASGSESNFTDADFSNSSLISGSFSFPVAA